MMVSAPDTPYGAAFTQFCLLLAKRPLNLAQLHEAFASLSSLAARDHPEMPWPTTMHAGDGRTYPFTVEALLTQRGDTYANMPAVPDDTVKELLMRWNGVSIKEVMTGWQGAGFQLRLAKKIRLGPNKTRTQDMGSLGVSCSWKLMQEQTVVCSSSDTDLHMDESLRVLKGITLISSYLGLKGLLILRCKTNSWLEVKPDGWVLSPDYHLDFGWDDQQFLLCYRFGGGFVANQQSVCIESEDMDDG